MKHYILLISAVLTGMFLSSCSQQSAGEPTRRTQFIMGTLVEITAVHADPKVANAAMTEAFNEMKRLEKLMSTYIPSSEISTINRNAGGEAVPVSKEVEEVIHEGLYWSEKSDGAFDISVEPLVQLWDFDGEKQMVPDETALQGSLSLVGYQDIELSDHKVRLARPGMAINVGGLAKGYAVDRAISILKEKVNSGIINAGGDLYAFGEKKDKTPWTIGLQHPRKPQALLAAFAVKGQAVATSGDYQRYFLKDGVRYHHIFDPKTGMPARKMISATIITTEVMEADALATALFVMGPEEGLEWVHTLANVQAMVVLEDESILYSREFRKQPRFVLK